MQVPLPIYLPFLALTLVIEAPIVVALLVRRCGLSRSLFVAFAASLVTHPLLWFVWPHVISLRHHYTAYVATGEILVVFIEAAIFLGVALRPSPKCVSLRTRAGFAFGVSVSANLASWGAGATMTRLGLLWPYVRVTSSWIAAAMPWLR